jgi:predicted amidohydrolase
LIREQGKTLRLALLKDVPVPWDLVWNWQSVVSLWKQAAEAGADLFVTPECFLDGYAAAEKDWSVERFARIAQERASSTYVEGARELARRYRMHALFCYTEKRAGNCYNTALLLDDEGRPIGHYDKTHLLDHDTRFAPGADLPVFATRLGKIGVVICADRRWPETVRVLRVRGAELVLVPSYGMCHEANEWWMRTRAYENEVHLAFCHPNVAFICDPQGQVPAKLQSNVPAVLIADIDLSTNPSHMLPHRRPGLYTPLCE